MTDLIEWFRAQLDEDERVAVAAGSGEWKSEPGGYCSGAVELANCGPGEDDIVVYDESRPTPEEATHIAAWDPARVLAEVKAKQAVLDALDLDDAGCEDCGVPDEIHLETCQGYRPNWRLARLMAQPYANRPDWQPEWSVGE